MAIAVLDRQPEGLRSLSGCIPVDAATAASCLSTAPIASRHAHPRWRKRMVIRLPARLELWKGGTGKGGGARFGRDRGPR